MRKSDWGETLTEPQRLAVERIHNTDIAGSIWTVFMTPSTGPARYVELRCYLSDECVARWIVERDGSLKVVDALAELETA